MTKGRAGVLSTTIALALLAGCNTPATAPGTDENTLSRGTGGTATTPVAPNGGQAQPEQPKTGDEPAPMLPPQVNADGLAMVDLTKPMKIKASEGGTFVSEDGLLTAVIPPGALSQDTEIRFARLDTSKQKNTNQSLSGIRFQMDIGDAYVMPGKKINVSAKADERLIPELQSMYDDYSPERYSLSQDAKGNWVVSMQVSGPADQPLDMSKAPDDPYLTNRRGIMTEGFAPLPAGKGGNFKKDSRIEAFCDYNPPPPPKPLRKIFANTKWVSDDDTLDGKAAYDADARYNTYVRFGNASTAAVSGVNGYWTKEFVAGSPATPEESRWEVASGSDATGIKTDSGTHSYANIGITKATMEKYDNEFFWPGEDESADGSLAGAAKNDLKSDFVSVDASNHLKVKIVTKPAKPAVADSWVDKFTSGWIDLTAGSNETIRSGYEWNGWCHCAWTVHRDKIVQDLNPQPVQPSGKASNWARETFTISAQGYTNEPNPTPGKYPGAGIGSTATTTITSGHNEVALTVPRYSPMLGLTLVADSSGGKKMEGDFTLTMNISGVGERSYTFGAPAGGAFSVPLNFRVKLPDNAPHTITFKSVHFGDDSFVGKEQDLAAISPLTVQRNGIYDGFTVNVLPIGAK